MFVQKRVSRTKKAKNKIPEGVPMHLPLGGDGVWVKVLRNLQNVDRKRMYSRKFSWFRN